MNIPDAHEPNFPWKHDEGTNTILDNTGMPVAMGLNYTSIRSGTPDKSGVIYNSSEYAGPIRARLIVAAVNKAAGF